MIKKQAKDWDEFWNNVWGDKYRGSRKFYENYLMEEPSIGDYLAHPIKNTKGRLEKADRFQKALTNRYGSPKQIRKKLHGWHQLIEPYGESGIKFLENIMSSSDSGKANYNRILRNVEMAEPVLRNVNRIIRNTGFEHEDLSNFLNRASQRVTSRQSIDKESSCRKDKKSRLKIKI